MSPISSSSSVPPCACSKKPRLRPCAPVNAPRSWPKSSLSISSRGIAAQFTRTNGSSRRGLKRWIARLTSSLPVPLSPVMSTLARVGATRSICWVQALHRGARADHLVARLELGAQLGHGPREPCRPHRVADAHEHPIATQRLLEKIARAELDRQNGVLHRRVPAHDDHGQLTRRFFGAQALEHLDARRCQVA